MNSKHLLTACAAAMLALSAFAQTPSSSSASPSSSLPSSDSPAGAATPGASDEAGAAASAAAAKDATNPFPVQSAFQYDDANPRNRAAGAPACDDATYGQAQVHGSVGAGVAAGNHVSGNYEAAVVHVTKALGSCDDPAGEVSVSVGVRKEDFNRTRRRHH